MTRKPEITKGTQVCRLLKKKENMLELTIEGDIRDWKSWLVLFAW